jgi:two-component system sensor histidine kinase BaeS
MWKKLSIGKKLFFAMMTIVIVVIAFVAFLLTLSMRSGFENYVLQAEFDRFGPVIDKLVERHDAANPAWPDLKDNRRAFNRLVRSEAPRNDPPARPRPKALNENSQNNTGKRRPPADPLQLNSRLALLNPQGDLVVGATFNPAHASQRRIMGVDSNGNAQLIGYLALAKPTRIAGNPSNLFLLDQIKFLILTLFVALLLSAGAAYWLSRQFTRPVDRLVSGTKRLALGEYDLRLEKTSEDEFGNLVEQFNLLAEQLAAQEVSERRWMSDTSHELQTPLAVLRAEIEALQDGVRKADQKTLATLHLSVTRLSALVKDISQLSHAREGYLVQDWEKTDLSSLALESANKVRGMIEEKGLTLETDFANDLVADCDTMRIGQLIDNVLTNAMRYTAAPGVIKLSTVKNDDHGVIIVEDSNSPPPQEAMDKLFDRFYRADQSRTRSGNKVGGSGLGLSICQLIAKSHHGNLKAEYSPLGGMAMVFQIPLIRKDEKLHNKQ